MDANPRSNTTRRRPPAIDIGSLRLAVHAYNAARPFSEGFNLTGTITGQEEQLSLRELEAALHGGVNIKLSSRKAKACARALMPILAASDEEAGPDADAAAAAQELAAFLSSV